VSAVEVASQGGEWVPFSDRTDMELVGPVGFDYIEPLYNARRRRGYSGGLSPVRYQQVTSRRLRSVRDFLGGSLPD